MAEDDIYKDKGKYERFVKNLNDLLKKPKERTDYGRQKYYCKNPKNLEYFKKLFTHFETQDTSYIRRLRLLMSFKLIVYAAEKDLAECAREDINKIVAFVNTVYSPRSQSDFKKDMRFMWKHLFPDKDEKGRSDETIVPYNVRHLNGKVDKSTEKRRNDHLNWHEYQSIVQYFSQDTSIQAYLTLALESLGRPQEILYTKIKDVELYDNYAKIWVSSHGKEGVKFLTSIDSFPYIQKWYNEHSTKKPSDYFFINTEKKRIEQLRPKTINVKLKTACSDLGINKNITCYSIKRNGVTFRRLRGDSDVEIQKVAGWTSTKQLKTYDQSGQEEVLKIELIKRGIIKSEDAKYKRFMPEMKTKDCSICGKTGIPFTSDICPQCLRPLDREKLRQQIEKYEMAMQIPQLKELIEKVNRIEKDFAEMKIKK